MLSLRVFSVLCLSSVLAKDPIRSTDGVTYTYSCPAAVTDEITLANACASKDLSDPPRDLVGVSSQAEYSGSTGYDAPLTGPARLDCQYGFDSCFYEGSTTPTLTQRTDANAAICPNALPAPSSGPGTGFKRRNPGAFKIRDSNLTPSYLVCPQVASSTVYLVSQSHVKGTTKEYYFIPPTGAAIDQTASHQCIYTLVANDNQGDRGALICNYAPSGALVHATKRTFDPVEGNIYANTNLCPATACNYASDFMKRDVLRQASRSDVVERSKRKLGGRR